MRHDERSAIRTDDGGSRWPGHDRDAIDLSDDERVAIGIGVGSGSRCQDVAAGGGVLGDGRAVVVRDRSGIRHVPGERLRSLCSRRIGRGDRHCIWSANRSARVDGSGDEARVRVDAQPRRQRAAVIEDEDIAAIGIAEVPRDVEAHAAAVAAVLRGDGCRGRSVVRPRDGIRHSGRVGSPFTIADGVGHGRRPRFPNSQIVEGRAGIERHRAGRAHSERATVGAGDARPNITRDSVDRADGERVAVGIAIDGAVRQYVATRGGVLGRREVVVDGGRSRVGDVPSENLRSRGSPRIGRGDRHRVRTANAGRRINRARDDAGRRINAQSRWKCSAVAEGQHVAGIAIGEVAADIQRDRHVVGAALSRNWSRCWRFIGSGDSDGQRRRGRAAFVVSHRVADGCDASFPRCQIVESCAGIERVAASGRDRKRAAVGACNAGSDISRHAVDFRHSECVAVRISVVADNVAGRRRSRCHCARVGHSCRSWVDDIPDKCLRCGDSRRIGGRDDNGIRAGDAGRWIDRPRNDASVRVDAQAWWQSSAVAEAQHIAAVGIAEVAADIQRHAAGIAAALSTDDG